MARTRRPKGLGFKANAGLGEPFEVQFGHLWTVGEVYIYRYIPEKGVRGKPCFAGTTRSSPKHQKVRGVGAPYSRSRMACTCACVFVLGISLQGLLQYMVSTYAA